MKNSLLKCGTVLMFATISASALAPVANAAGTNTKAPTVKVEKKKAKAATKDVKEVTVLDNLKVVNSVTGQIDSGIVDFPIVYANNGDIAKDEAVTFNTVIDVSKLDTNKLYDKEVTVDFGVQGGLAFNKDIKKSTVNVTGISEKDGKFTEEVTDLKVGENGHLTGKLKVREGIKELNANFEFGEFDRKNLDLNLGDKNAKVITLNVTEDETPLVKQVVGEIALLTSPEAAVMKATIKQYGEDIKGLQAFLNETYLTEKPADGGETEKPGDGGETEKPGDGGETEKPGDGGETEKPGDGGETEKPGTGGETEKPGTGNGSGSTGGTNTGNGSGSTGGTNTGNGSGSTGGTNTGNGSGTTGETSKEATIKAGQEAGRKKGRADALAGNQRNVSVSDTMGNVTAYIEAYEAAYFKAYDDTQKAMVEAFIAGYKAGYEDQKANRNGVDPDKRAPYAVDFGDSFDVGYKTGQQDAKDGKESRELYFTNNPKAALDLIYAAKGKTTPTGTQAKGASATTGAKSESDPQTGVETHQNAGLIAGLLGVTGLGAAFAFFKSRKKS